MAGKETIKKSLLNINLPAPPNQNPSEKLSYGAHNAVHLKNYEEIANIIQKIINNQKMLALSLTNLEKKINKLEKPIKVILQNLNKLNLKEKPNGQNK